jgi:beta-lactamase class A
VETKIIPSKDSIKLSRPVELNAHAIFKKLERKLRSNFNISREERLGLCLFDLKNDAVVASINGRQTFQTGSMIKLFIAYAALKANPKWFLKRDCAEYKLLVQMLKKSSNAAANQLLSKLGGPDSCQSILEQLPNIFLNTHIRSAVPKDGKQYQSTSSPQDCVRLLREIYTSKDKASKEFLSMLSEPARCRFRLKKDDGFSLKSSYYNKTGSTGRVCCESSIIVPDQLEVPFVLCVIIDRTEAVSSCEAWLPAREKCLNQFAQEAYGIMRRMAYIVNTESET